MDEVTPEKIAFALVLRDLAANFGTELTPGRIAAYWEIFRDVPEGVFGYACAQAKRNERFFPAPVDLMRHAATLDPDMGEAAAQAAWVRLLAASEAWTPGTDWGFVADAPTRAGLLAIGGARRLTGLSMTDMPFVRKEFIAAHERAATVAAHARIGLAPPPPPALPAAVLDYLPASAGGVLDPVRHAALIERAALPEGEPA